MDNRGFDAEPHMPVPADTQAPASSFPWPPSPDESVLGAIGRTWSEASLHPTRFFASMPSNIGMGPAILYYLGLSIAVAAANLFWSQILPQPEPDPSLTGPLALLAGIPPVIQFLVTPILAMLGLFLGAALTHALLLMLTTQRGTYARTVCVYCFAYSPMVLGVIPWIGVLVGVIWMLVVFIKGIREAHGTTTGRAAVAVLAPTVLLFIAFMIVVLMAVAGAVLLTR